MRIHCFLLCLLLSSKANAASPWHESLSLANGGYWPTRVAVTVTNASDQPVAGQTVEITAPSLAGDAVESVRVCQQNGIELLFDLRDTSGAPLRSGVLADNTRLILPVECAPANSVTLFVYTGNREAWPVPDFLRTDGARASADITASVGDLEKMALERTEPLVVSPAASGPGAEVLVRNLNERALSSALVRVNLGPVFARLPGLPLNCTTTVTRAEGTELTACILGRDLFFPAELRARAEHRFRVRFDSAARNERDADQEYQRLLGSSANLAPNGDFERGQASPEGWSRSSVAADATITSGFSEKARFGRRCLDLAVPENKRGAWLGWTSREIAVRPGAMYLLSGWLKATDLQGSATIHAHFHNTSGALTQTGAMTSTQPTVGGTSAWTNSRGLMQAPPDAATVQLHLTLNSEGKLRHDGLVLCEVVDGTLTTVHSAPNVASANSLEVWEVNPLVKVFPDTPPNRPPSEIHVELAQNEYEPVQLALRRTSIGSAQAQISVSAPRNEAGQELPAVRVERVGFVPIDQASAYYTAQGSEWQRKTPRGAPATDGWAGWWPDPLAPGAVVDLAQSRTQPIWFTVHAPGSAAPGVYLAKVSISIPGSAPTTIPITIRVLPFALPQRTQLRAIFDLRFGPGGKFGAGAENGEHRRAWLRFLAERRLGIDAIEPAPKFTYQDGKVSMDARAFDETARYSFDELGINVCYTPQFFYMFGWAYPPKKFFGLAPFTPEWTSAFKQAYTLFTEHLREKGWHDRFVYYISDEPHFQHDFVVAQMQKLCALIHEVDPDIPIYSSTWRHCAAWDNSLDLWGIGQYGCFPVEDMLKLQRLGKRMWFTCDGQMATDTPFLATERMLPYYCFKYGAQGFEFWGMAWWTYDPWQVGWHQFIRQSDEGKNYYWIRYPNGDGYLAYPGKSVGVDGPVSTIRLEQVREGLEDYEAMTLLATKAEEARHAGKAVAAADRALVMARDLVTIPNSGGLRSTEILPDPDRIPVIRKAVNAALVELMQPPAP
jgi:hypothetical protein